MNTSLLHRFLGVGLVLTTAVLFFVRTQAVAPQLGDASALIAYFLSGTSVVMLGVAFFVFKPLVPVRQTGQPVQEYWSNPQVGGKALLVWSLMEGAGIMSAVGYFLTGETVSLLTVGLAIAAFWLSGPAAFTNS